MTGRQEREEIKNNRIQRRIDAAPQIIQEYSYTFGDKTVATKENYIGYAISFVEFFKDADIYSLKQSDIQQYLEHIKYRIVNGEKIENSVSNRATKLYALKDFYTFLEDNGYITSNPTTKIKPPHIIEEKEVVALTPKEIKKLNKNIERGTAKTKNERKRQEKWKTRDNAILNLAISTGLRVSSIVEINMEDVDYNNNSIRVVEKGNKVRSVYFGDKVKQDLYSWMSDRERLNKSKTNALFIGLRGRMSPVGVADVLKQYAVGIDKHITPHKLRSTCATNVYEKTGDIYLVQSVLGHSNIANTRRYAKMSEERRRNAADIMDRLL